MPETLGKQRRRPSWIFTVRTLATNGIEEHASPKHLSASTSTSAKSVVESTVHANARMLRPGVFEPCARHSFYVRGLKQISVSDALCMPPQYGLTFSVWDPCLTQPIISCPLSVHFVPGLEIGLLKTPRYLMGVSKNDSIIGWVQAAHLKGLDHGVTQCQTDNQLRYGNWLFYPQQLHICPEFIPYILLFA